MVLDATSTDTGSSITTLVVFVLAIFVYFLPIVVAVNRHTMNAGAVGVVNVLLGWTVIGWIVALAMAAGGSTEEQVKARATVPAMAAPVISPDGKSWWNGQQWLPLPSSEAPGNEQTTPLL